MLDDSVESLISSAKDHLALILLLSLSQAHVTGSRTMLLESNLQNILRTSTVFCLDCRSLGTHGGGRPATKPECERARSGVADVSSKRTQGVLGREERWRRSVDRAVAPQYMAEVAEALLVSHDRIPCSC